MALFMSDADDTGKGTFDRYRKRDISAGIKGHCINKWREDLS